MYFGDQYKLCIKIVIYHLSEKIYTTCNENNVVFFLIINVFVAYPNIFYQYLLHNLHKKRIDVEVVN